MMNDVPQVIHEPSRQRFLIALEGRESVLEYRMSGVADVVFTRTYVPPALRRRGLAERLVRTGLAWARAENLNISATCWYVRRFLR